ncbi:hypothetical protein INR20_26495, partial [Escherichia coli]|nr:hypothetical protein [Escherichia coli]
FSGGNIAAGIAGTLAGGLLMKYTSPGRALLTAYGVQGIALLAAWVAYIRLHSARELMTSAID